MKKFLMTSAAVLALASTAQAEGDFHGFYAGVNGGYATAKTNRTIGIVATSVAASGFTGGVHAGYNHQINNIVLGAELGFNFGNLEWNVGAASLKRKNEFLAAARVGYVVNNWLPYVKAGWNNAKFSTATSTRLNGFLVGAGVETVLSNNVTAGAEWSTVNYKDKTGFAFGRTQEFKVRLGYKF